MSLQDIGILIFLGAVGYGVYAASGGTLPRIPLYDDPTFPPQPAPASGDFVQAAQAAVSGALQGAGLFGLTGGNNMTANNGRMSVKDVKALAQRLIDAYGFNVSANVAAAVAIVESGSVGNPLLGCDPHAFRSEPQITDQSTGIMQVLTGTAQWLAKSQGYKAYGVPSMNDLYTPSIGMYFGLAYLDYLSRYGGAKRSTEWMVQSYNAGPGHAQAAYLAKFQKALQWVQLSGV